uniref:Uncharacterized protein n=1 Tax=Microviridae sp. ctJKB8 TaxID=2824991 RepID=A0A8S5URY8_9VIRU|nr:MAG TPA: hypothetical protein [Microviridae sp. ctJKB8]
MSEGKLSYHLNFAFLLSINAQLTPNCRILISKKKIQIICLFEKNFFPLLL